MYKSSKSNQIIDDYSYIIGCTTSLSVVSYWFDICQKWMNRPIEVSHNNIVFHGFENVDSTARKGDFGGSIKTFFRLQKSATESHRLLVEAYDELLYHKHSAKSGCDDSELAISVWQNEERGRPPKRFEDAELQALLDKDGTKTQNQLAEQLNVTQTSITVECDTSKHLLTFGSHDVGLKMGATRIKIARNPKNDFSNAFFFIESWRQMKSGPASRILNGKNHRSI